MTPIQFWILLLVTLIVNLIWPPLLVWWGYNKGKMGKEETLSRAASIERKVDLKLTDVDKNFLTIQNFLDVVRSDIQDVISRISAIKIPDPPIIPEFPRIPDPPKMPDIPDYSEKFKKLEELSGDLRTQLTNLLNNSDKFDQNALMASITSSMDGKIGAWTRDVNMSNKDMVKKEVVPEIIKQLTPLLNSMYLQLKKDQEENNIFNKLFGKK